MDQITCYEIINEIMKLYNHTCGRPCCVRSWNKTDLDTSLHHHETWPMMTHNTLLFTPQARQLLCPLSEYINSKLPGSIGKEDDQATERLWGLFHNILLERHGSIWEKPIVDVI